MAILGKKLVLDMARMAALSYESSDKLDTAYLYERPYMKGCHQMALLSIKEKPCFVSSEEDCQVVVAKYLCPDDKEKLVVAFRGTESGEDILTDLNISQEKLPLENMNEEDWPLVHSGFAGQFFSVNTKLDDAIADADSVLFCGHSLVGLWQLLDPFIMDLNILVNLWIVSPLDLHVLVMCVLLTILISVSDVVCAM